VADDLLYLLFPSRFEVYNIAGELQHEWEACSDNTDYCAMTIAEGAVFATDAVNKHICKYSTDGNFLKFIQSPNRFIIPSYSFGITYSDGIIYASNSGRHQIEKYNAEGEYLGAFGEAGNSAGMFCGCCNPVHLNHTPTGEIITSEKGIPRISCYSRDGAFQSLLLDSSVLNKGKAAYHAKILNDKIFVAGDDAVLTFRYDNILAEKTTCSTCKVDCLLRKGTLI